MRLRPGAGHARRRYLRIRPGHRTWYRRRPVPGAQRTDTPSSASARRVDAEEVPIQDTPDSADRWPSGHYRRSVRSFEVVDGDDREEEPDSEPLDPCRLDFYCDYGAEIPLWINGTGMARARRVPVTAGLVADLMAFQALFEDGFGEDDETPFPDDFVATG